MAAKYWYQSGANAHWNTVTGNWWNDSGHSSQAAAKPVNGDDVYLIGSTAPDTSPSFVILHRFDTSNFAGNFLASSCDTADINIAGVGSTLLIGKSGYNHEFGGFVYPDANCTFQYSSTFSASGVISGDVLFDGASTSCQGEVGGTATFNGGDATDTVYIYNAIFNNATASGASNIDYATFNGTSSITSSTAVIGFTATFNDSSYVSGAMSIGTATFNNNSGAYNGITIATAVCNDNSYLGLDAGDVVITSSATFNDSSVPYAIATSGTVSVEFNGNGRTIIDAFIDTFNLETVTVNVNVPDITFQYDGFNWVGYGITVNGDCTFIGLHNFGSTAAPTIAGDNQYSGVTFTAGTFNGEVTATSCTIGTCIFNDAVTAVTCTIGGAGGAYNADVDLTNCSQCWDMNFNGANTVTAHGNTSLNDFTFDGTAGQVMVFAADSTLGYNFSNSGTWPETIKVYANVSLYGDYQPPTTVYFYSPSVAPMIENVTSGQAIVQYAGASEVTKFWEQHLIRTRYSSYD